MGAEENHQGKIVSHNIPFAFSGSHIISYKTQDDILLTGSQVWWWWNVEIVEGSNLCAGQFEEGAALGLRSSVTRRVLGGDLDKMWNTEWLDHNFHLINLVSHHS